MIVYFALMLAGQLIGLYDTPAKCDRAKVAQLQIAPAAVVVCVRKELPLD